MRRLTVYLLAALVAFVVGLAGYMFWFAPNSYLLFVRGEPVTVTLCELGANRSSYHGKMIRIRAILYSDLGGPYLTDRTCELPYWPLVDVTGFRGLSPELQEWVQNIGEIDAPGEELESEIIVTGLFDAQYQIRGADTSFHISRIIPQRIEQLSPLSLKP